MTERTQTSGPLTGIRVVDLTRMMSGPIATMMLGDQGADVIKVEPPAGDLVRHMGPNRQGLTATFISANRSKRSIAVDLKTPAGVEVLQRLVATADVFVQNFRPGTVERMGFSEAAVRAIKPDIVYVSISGFGESGPYVGKRAYDPVIQALSGLADIQKDGDSGRPKMVRTIIPDMTTAVTAAQAITAALFARERGGEGQHVRLSMLDTMVAYLWPEGMSGFTFVGGEVHESRAQLAQDLIFETTDGFITAGANSDAEWHGLCRALEREEWMADPRFDTPNVRLVNVKERLSMTAEVLATESTAHWLARLDAEGVPCAPVLERREVLEQEQVRVNDVMREHEHPTAGRIRQPRPAARFERTPSAAARHAPRLGEHTAELLGELALDVEDLVAQGAVVVAP